MYLFLVESPLQLIGALEASRVSGNHKSHFIIRFSGKTGNDNQLHKLIKTYSLTGFTTFQMNTQGKLRTFKLVYVLTKFFARYRTQCTRLYLGNFFSLWMRLLSVLLSKQDCWLLDDGTATIWAYDKFFKKGNFSGGMGRFSFLVGALKFVGFQRNIEPIFNLFTFLTLQPVFGQLIVKHSYELAREMFQGQHAHSVYGQGYFIGSSCSEKNLFSETEEIELIAKAKSIYDDRNMKMVYIAHRHDSETKKVMIHNILKVEVISLDIPVELYFLVSKEVPVSIAGFCSTALLTLQVLLNLNEIYSVVFDFPNLPPEVEAEYLADYEYLERHGAKLLY